MGARYMSECSSDDSGLTCPRVPRPRPEGEVIEPWGRQHGKGRRFGGKFGQDDHDFKKHGFGKGDWQKKHDEGQRAEMWEAKKESPVFQFFKAGDFGFGGPMGRHQYGGWRRHHGRGNWMDCEAEDNNDSTFSQ